MTAHIHTRVVTHTYTVFPSFMLLQVMLGHQAAICPLISLSLPKNSVSPSHSVSLCLSLYFTDTDTVLPKHKGQ